MTSGGTSEAANEFEAFFETHERGLYGTLCLVTGDPSEAEDVMQEAFLKMWDRWELVRAADDPPAYLYRTAFNVFRSRVRRAVRATRRVVRPTTMPDAFAQIDEREDLLAMLRRLTPRQRAAVVLLDLMDLPSGEAAEVLGVKAVTVRTLAFQARRALQSTVEQRNA